MVDTAAVLWEIELVRARQWLAATRKNKQVENERIFQRVKTHIAFKDHEMSLQNDAVVSEDEEGDLALDFLSDIDASDINMLLQAEAAKVTTVGALRPEESEVPIMRDAMTPLEMPANLISPDLTIEMDVKSVTASATSGNETGSQEMMQKLKLNMTELKPIDVEERKTEESTPPHLLKTFINMSNLGSSGAQVGAEQSFYTHQVLSKSPQAPNTKRVESTTIKQHDEVAKEMMGWVSGYRDPEVIRRKETMRRKRKQTNRFGVGSEEERRQALDQLKTVDGNKSSSDSENGDNMSSDYSPAEDEDTLEDESEEINLFSDESDEEKRLVNRKRKKTNQAGVSTSKRKKMRLRKPAVTHQPVQRNSSYQDSNITHKVQPFGGPAKSGVRNISATTKSASIESSPTSISSQAIDQLSGRIEVAKSKNSTSVEVEPILMDNQSGHSAVMELTGHERTKESTISRLPSPTSVTSLQSCAQKESNPSEVRNVQSDLTKPTSLNDDKADSYAVLGDTVLQSAADECPASKVNKQTLNTDDNASAAINVSSMGTVGMECKENTDVKKNASATCISISAKQEDMECKRNTDVKKIGSETCISISAKQEDAALNANNDSKREVKSALELLQQIAELDEDLSEAETEILEDDECDTNDVSLDDDGSRDGVSESSTAEKSPLIADGDTLGDKPNGTASETKAMHNSDTAPPPTNEFQQFFDFAPLKLKPKVKTTTSIAPKPLPIHSDTMTHSNVEKENGKSVQLNSKTSSVVSTKSSIGSNGLRPSKKAVLSTTMKSGKFLKTRRSTKMLDDIPIAKKPQKSQYTMVVTKNSKSSSTKELDDVPLSCLMKELSRKTEDKPQTKYLSYVGGKKVEEPKKSAVEGPRIVSKSRYGGGAGLSSIAAQNTPAASNSQHSKTSDKIPAKFNYRQEPQMSIYDALHMEGQETMCNIREATGYKRPSAFKKMQEEASRSGIPLVRSKLQDKDWDKVPIPKKQKQRQQEEEPALSQPSQSKYHDSSTHEVNSKSKRSESKSASTYKSSGSSRYRPQTSQHVVSNTYDLLPREQSRYSRSNGRRNDDRKRNRSSSPHSRKSSSRDDHRRRGSSRSRSHSPSPRFRDKSRLRSRQRSRSRDRSSERNSRRTERKARSDRDRDRETDGRRRSSSPSKRDTSKTKNSTTPSNPGKRDTNKTKDSATLQKLDAVCQNGYTGGKEVVSEDQTIPSDTSPVTGPLSTFDGDGDHVFISDSDNDDNDAVFQQVDDIRFDLESVPVDEPLMMRQIYVTGLNPTVSAEQIAEDFARFGVEIDRDTGFPAIDVFVCQRNYLGRGDARVTFTTEKGAHEAVEELNSKNVKNSLICVRPMDRHTQRILTVQFQVVRDTWKCPGTQCRADVSVWNGKCDKCGRKRVYGPSNIKIKAESWLCSLCFTANEPFSTSCHGCMESLPEVDRSTFYSS